jgi:hypothetical protein
MYPTSIKNDGAGDSPLATLIANSMVLRSSSSVAVFDSLKRQNAKAFDVGSQGNVNAYKSLGLIVG